MNPGDVVAERFVIEQLAGSGGMGLVYRAVDRTTGGRVALKLVHEHAQSSDAASRFSREATVLAELKHPGVVRYVEHGRAGGSLYLAMEWLDGETLGERLRGSGLTLEESVACARRVADALAAAHWRGIVHRDLKPSNLFLVGGSVERIKVLDFGIARLHEARRQLTLTGAMLGTPGYMAPEQARGDREIDARADVFALGCVLFKCLTGRSAFAGEDGLAALLRVVLDEAPRVSQLREDVPDALDDLVARMLAKDPDERPSDAAALAAELEALGPMAAIPGGRVIRSPSSLTTTERRVMCLVVARVARGSEARTFVDAPRDAAAPTVATQSQPVSITVDSGADTQVRLPAALSEWLEREHALRTIAERYGGKLHWLADGSLLVTVDPTGAATDQASRAANCALQMRPLLAGIPMAIVARRAIVSTRSMSEVIDRAVGLLGGPDETDAVRLDEVVAGLLDARFDVGGDDAGLLLRGKRDVEEARRTLLGRPSPCVGRERELALLQGMFDACVEEPMARAVVVSSEAGVGKSRLRYELLHRLLGRGHELELWFSRGDPMSAGSSFGMIVRAIQRAASLLDGEPLAVRQQKLRARLCRHLPADLRARVTEFLGELVGVPFDDDQSVQLRAARADPILMGDQMRRAWEDWVAAECTAQPVVLVLEDMHWGDLPSVRFVDSALRNLADRPFFVLALARPEISHVFPKLWSGRTVDHVQLGDLTRRGAERLVREVLGASVDEDTVARLVDRAAGNAFYLEELIRAVAAGRSEALPETILAMAQTRLETLSAEERRVLRAASVFGQVFWSGGVSALLGGADPSSRTDDWLGDLAQQEVVTRRGEGKFPGEDEFIFRHSLLREAAYATLTDADRALGHRLAGAWLVAAGERDAAVLAEHFERGGEPAGASVWYRRSAEQALEGNDFGTAITRADRALALAMKESIPLDERAAGGLSLLQAEAHRWRGETKEAEQCALAAMRSLEPGTIPWLAAAGHAALASGQLGDAERLAEVAGALAALPDDVGASGARIIAESHAAAQLLFAGMPDRAAPLLARMDAFEQGPDDDPAAWAWVHSARATVAQFAGDPGENLRRYQLAVAEFERAGDLRNACMERGGIGYALMEVGAWGEAVEELRVALDSAERMGLSNGSALAKHNLGLALAHQGELEEGRRLEAEAVAAFVEHGHRRLEGGARIYLATILVLMGRLDAADEQAARALEGLSSSPPGVAEALAMVARVKLAKGEVSEARTAAIGAADLLERLGGLDEGESAVRLALAEALAASGETEAAARCIAVARDRLHERAARIRDEARRRSFLERIPENARTLELASQWL